MFVCNVCHFMSSSLRAYAHHFRFHRNVNQFNFPCVFKGCQQSFSSYNNFARHVSKQHYAAQYSSHVNATVKLKCIVTLCRQDCSDLSEFIKHLKQHLVNGVVVACPYKNCDKTFKLKSSNITDVLPNLSVETVYTVIAKLSETGVEMVDDLRLVTEQDLVGHLSVLCFLCD